MSLRRTILYHEYRMELTSVQILLIVDFLHYVSSGLVAPVLANHLVANGANHIFLGFLVSSSYMSYKISKDFLTIFELQKRNTIALCLYSTFITYLVLVFFENRWVIYLDRVVFSLTNQVSWFLKEYAVKTQPKITHVKILNLFDITNVAGCAVGSIIGGYTYDYFGEFTQIAVVTSLLMLLALYYLQGLEPDSVSTSNRSEQLLELPTLWSERIKILRNTDFTERWDSILLLLSYTFSFTIYFSRFSYLLPLNYPVATSVIGKSLAYQCSVKFITHILLPFFKHKILKKRLFFKCCLVMCALSVTVLLSASRGIIYYIVFIPVIVTYCLINEFLAEDILRLEEDVKQARAVASLRSLVNSIGPLCFGILVYFLGRNGLVILGIFPLMVCVYIIRQSTLQEQEDVREGAEEVVAQ